MAKAKKKVVKKKAAKKNPPGFSNGKVTYSEGSIEYTMIRAARDLEATGNIRIDKVCFIALHDNNDMLEAFEELLESMGEEHAQKILPIRNGYAYNKKKDDCNMGKGYWNACIWETVTSLYPGQLVVEVLTPVYRWEPSKHSKEGITSLSWGYTKMNWFAGWNMKDIIAEANAWAIKSQEEDVRWAKADYAKSKRKPKAKK